MRFVVLVMIAGCWSGTPPPPAPIANRVPTTSPIRLPSPRGAQVGVFQSGQFIPTTEIPLFAGSTFGWRLQIADCTGELIAVREELLLPAPGDWGTSPTLEISSDRATARTRDDLECSEHGWIEKQWTVSAGDPPGDWIVRVTPDGYATTTFHITFAPPTP